MLRRILTSVALVGWSAVGFSAAHTLNFDDSPQHETIADFQAFIPSGESTQTVNFTNPQNAADLSIWHEEQIGCRGFGIITAKARNDGDAQWTTLNVEQFRGVTYYHAPTAFKQIELKVVNNQILAQNCHVLVRKANFAVPHLMTVLAKVQAPVCSGGDNGAARTCECGVSRIDEGLNQNLPISEYDFKFHNLKAGSIYKLTGYMEYKDGVNIFSIESALFVM